MLTVIVEYRFDLKYFAWNTIHLSTAKTFIIQI